MAQSLWQWFSLLSPTGKICAGIALFLTIIGTYYSFTPKIAIMPSDSLNPDNPFATPFIIRNESLLPVYSITPTFIRRKIDTAAKGYIAGFDREREKYIVPIPSLKPGESTTFIIPYPIIMMIPITFADIEIMVSYRPCLSPFSREYKIRFVTVPGTDEKLRWHHKSLSE